MQRATKRSTSRLIFGQKKCVASTSSVFFTPKCPINPPPCTSCNNKRRTELVGMHSLFARNTKPSLTTNLFHVLPSLQLPSKIYIRNISTLKWWNIQFQFREMVMISYRRGSPNITIICMWTTWWLWCWWLHVVLIVINLILIISHIIILLRISSRSHRSINSSTSSLARLKRDTDRSAKGCFPTWRYSLLLLLLQRCGMCSRWWKTRKQFIKSVIELCFERLLHAIYLLHGLFKSV